LRRKLSNCEITAIQKGVDTELPVGYERIGFVFPTYGWGLVIMVSDFLSKASLLKQDNTYLFAVATCLGMTGNAIPQANALLKEKGCFASHFMKCFNIGAPTISHHLKELANAELIYTEKRGKFLFCKVNEEIVNEVNKLLNLQT